MDDAPLVGCRASRGTFTAGKASSVTRQSDLGKADFSASDTGVISYPDLTLFYTGRGRSGYEINTGQGLDLFLSCLELSLTCKAPIACVEGAKRGGAREKRGKREGSACYKSRCFCIPPTIFLN